MLPRLNNQKGNNNQSVQSWPAKSLRNSQPQLLASNSTLPTIPHKAQVPTIAEGGDGVGDSLKAYHKGIKAHLPLLPIVNSSVPQGQHAVASALQPGLETPVQSEQSAVLVEYSSELTAARHVPHYARPQDRTPLWSERDRPGRFSTPKNPYKQNLDLAPKLNSAATRYSSPAKYGPGSELLLGLPTLEASWWRSPRQGQSQPHLAPPSPTSLAPAAMLQQASQIVISQCIKACVASRSIRLRSMRDGKLSLHHCCRVTC